MGIRELFDKCASAYDQDRRKLVPNFDDLYGTALQVIPYDADANIQVLDLGAGTGLLSAIIAKAFPFARLHLTDISEPMLAQARKRFSDDERVTYALQEHTQLSAEADYDLVVSALSIHHLDDMDKQVLFRCVFDALRLGGMFINVDQALGPGPSSELDYERRWLADVRGNGATELSIEQAQERMREDKSAPLTEQLRWLSGAGFQHVDCWYKRFRFVVLGGVKPN